MAQLTLTADRMSRRGLLGVLFAAAGGTVVAACGQASGLAPSQPAAGVQAERPPDPRVGHRRGERLER